MELKVKLIIRVVAIHFASLQNVQNNYLSGVEYMRTFSLSLAIASWVIISYI